MDRNTVTQEDTAEEIVKTTVSLPRDLHTRAKVYAARHPEVTVQQLVIDGLRRELDRLKA